MRVLDTTTLEFKEFPDLPSEPYAILSHRWGNEEVSYKEYRKSRGTIEHRAGYKKIMDFCHVARQRGYRYAWIDTCCIDKRSSAELSEAINSMYKWYKQSAHCYVLLEDYDPQDPSSLKKCEWFTRGWTLQELLAPENSIYFAADWTAVGHTHFKICADCKVSPAFRMSRVVGNLSSQYCGHDLRQDLAAITGIEEQYICGWSDIRDASIAQRMGWACSRKTTREEDRAYSLLGIFDINMPLLYGEGWKSFQRLQEEIIRTSHDTSLFCFQSCTPLSLDESLLHFPNSQVALPFAHSPDDFLRFRDVRCGRIEDNEYSITNRGLRMVARCYMQSKVFDISDREGHVYAIPLGCRRNADESMYLIAVNTSRPGSSDLVDVVKWGVQCSKEEPPRFDRTIWWLEGNSDDMHEKRDWVSVEPRLFYITLED